jgi:membrane associated rhomboid family serine protease
VSYRESSLQASFPRPGPVLKVVLIGVFAVWLAFAVGINWANASYGLFELLCGNTELILHGQVWRLLTAPWLHQPSGTLGHVLSALLGLYFLSPTLESRWGSARFARFLLFSSLFAYGTQLLAEVVLPRSLALRISAQDGFWFGAIPVVEAIVVAWAMNARGQMVRLFFVLPVTPGALVLFSIAMSLMYVVIGAQGTSGLVAPFGGMLAGWIFGGTPSPLRRLYLKLRLAQLDAEAKREGQQRRRRVQGSGLRVISGGKDGKDGKDARDDDDEPGQSGNGRWLN